MAPLPAEPIQSVCLLDLRSESARDHGDLRAAKLTTITELASALVPVVAEPAADVVTQTG